MDVCARMFCHYLDRARIHVNGKPYNCQTFKKKVSCFILSFHLWVSFIINVEGKI